MVRKVETPTAGWHMVVPLEGQRRRISAYVDVTTFEPAWDQLAEELAGAVGQNGGLGLLG